MKLLLIALVKLLAKITIMEKKVKYAEDKMFEKLTEMIRNSENLKAIEGHTILKNSSENSK